MGRHEKRKKKKEGCKFSDFSLISGFNTSSSTSENNCQNLILLHDSLMNSDFQNKKMYSDLIFSPDLHPREHITIPILPPSDPEVSSVPGGVPHQVPAPSRVLAAQVFGQ